MMYDLALHVIYDLGLQYKYLIHHLALHVIYDLGLHVQTLDTSLHHLATHHYII